MKPLRLFGSIQLKLIIIYVLLILIAMQLIGVYFVNTVENSFTSNFTESLNNRVDLLTQYVGQYMSGQSEREQGEERTSYDDLHDVVSNFNKISGAEVQVLDSSGVILVSSNPMLVGQKKTQPEIAQALQGFSYEERVIDNGVRKLALAYAVKTGSRIIGAVYVTASMEEMYGTIDSINQIFIAGTMIALGLTALLGILLSNTITNPIKEITRTAKAMADGSFNQQVRVSGNDEIGQLGQAFNYMVNRLKDALSANEEEKDKLASILANMSDGVIATDDMGKIIVMNKRAHQMLRLTEEVIGSEISSVLGMAKPEIDRHVLGDQQTAMIELGATEEDEHNVVRVSFTPIYRRERIITGTIIVLQDVTEQEKLEHSRREFVANVSHELRTPLTTIKSYLEALQDGAIEEQELAHRFVGVASNETERMIRLVTDLLHLSRFDSKQTVVTREPTDIASMLEEVADRFAFQMQQRRIAIQVYAPDPIPAVPLDPDQIDQVLDNLVSNAVKYTPEGGTITLEATRVEGEQVEVAVQDTGAGIPKKDLQHIFERFYRVDKARSRNMGGTGLGLSIAREIIKAHNGFIYIESEVNKGTRVSFTLPLEHEGE